MRRVQAVTVGTCVLAMAMFAAACDRNGANPGGAATTPASVPGAAADAVRQGGRAADAAMETFDVKAALMRDTRVDAGDINVDTNHQTKTVVLKGRVPTADQKTIAGDIATTQAKGYRVQNDLMVGQS